MRAPIPSIHRIMLIAHVGFAAAWLSVADRVSWAAAVAALHLTAPFLRAVPLFQWFSQRWATIRGRMMLICGAVPLALIIAFWLEIGILRRAAPPVYHDARIAGWDHSLFGSWAYGFPSGSGWDVFFFTLYLSYYVLVFGLPLFLGLGGRTDALRDTGTRLLLTYIACDLVYLVVPVLGPRAALASDATTGGALAGFAEMLRDLGDSPGTAFPSSHVAGAITAALLALRYLPVPWRVVWMAGALGVGVSTVATGNHYATDAVAGALCALFVQGPVARLFIAGRSPGLSGARPCFPRYNATRLSPSKREARLVEGDLP